MIVFSSEIQSNFWKHYPELQLEFNDVYSKDTSKDKKKSSTLMWGLLLYCHPESNLYSSPNKEETILKTVIKDKNFRWTDYLEMIDRLVELVLTEAEKSLVAWNETMRERRKKMTELYDAAFEAGEIDDLVKIDKMMASTAKFFEDYKKIKKDYEEDKIKKHGKSIASLSDNDEI